MQQFNSGTSSRVTSMHFSHRGGGGGAFDSNNTAYQQQVQAIAQGAVAHTGAADMVFRAGGQSSSLMMSGQNLSRPTSLDGRCVDAIMALGGSSSGDNMLAPGESGGSDRSVHN